ncbi:hypothetical protein C2I18_13340 [Paenibacillus sp. PK3_47]|uniref:hypothetical protein n=1 Tax=Paenibacillus sp. PK3_47 TaxID=2072642 RepID=UPI00201E585C|nr:hypothetical protein [Paenibacillus sp. PK3_47]UQZ34415.1 hypothetical protein C2I18_13340 [Paenibacillus sp. PK3_47]
MLPYKEKELKEILLKKDIGDVDLSGRVMKQLYAEQQQKERVNMRYRYKVGVMVITGMLLTASSGFAAVHYQSLSNKNGDVTYQVKPAAEFPAMQEEEIQRLDFSRELGEKLLEEGTAAIFYVIPHNPEGVTDTRLKPVTYSDWSVLQSKLSGQSVKIAEQLAGGYSFHSASVRYMPVNLVNPPAPEEAAATADKLRKQTEQSGKDYAMLPVELSDQIDNLTAAYRQGDKEITVHISRTKGPVTAYMDEQVEFTAEKLVFQGVEMVYTKYKGGNSLAWSAGIPGRQENILYEMHEMSGQYFSKEEMLGMAAPFLK